MSEVAVPVTEPKWEDCEAIVDDPQVDETIRNFLADQTSDNVICMVREILRARQRIPCD